jgi:hypothetical protein
MSRHGSQRIMCDVIRRTEPFGEFFYSFFAVRYSFPVSIRFSFFAFRYRVSYDSFVNPTS